MSNMFLSTILVAALFGSAVPPPATPHIEALNKGASFKITFPKGASEECVVFVQQTLIPKSDESLWKIFPDGHYAPKSCLWLDGSETTFNIRWPFGPEKGTWDVHVDVGYPIGKPIVKGNITTMPDLNFVKSNVVTVTF